MSIPSPNDTFILDAAAMWTHFMERVQASSGQRQLARELDVRQAEISLAASGKRPVSKAVARALGFDRVVQPRRVTYVRRRTTSTGSQPPSSAGSPQLSTHRARARRGGE